MVRKFLEFYKTTAIIFFNTCLLLALVLIFYIVFQPHISIPSVNNSESIRNPLTKYGEARVYAMYPDMKPVEVERLLKDTWSRPVMYEPFTEFKERSYRSRYVNVHPAGFRVIKNQGPWPPNKKYFNIFVFGGSTVFGYGVKDDETIASYMQEALAGAGLKKEVRVYNFGQGNFFSTQECLLFIKLLQSRIVPDAAVFIDGLNEFRFELNDSMYKDELNLFVQALSRHRWQVEKSKVDALNFQKLLKDKAIDITHWPPMLEAQVSRYESNKKMAEAIGQAFHVQTVFVWQPVSCYKYDSRYHNFNEKNWTLSATRAGYALMAAYVKRKNLGDNFIWLADMQENSKEALYVDSVHYLPKMARSLAKTVLAGMNERGLFSGIETTTEPAQSFKNNLPTNWLGSAGRRKRPVIQLSI